MRLSIKATNHLKAMDKYLRKNSRKSNITNTIQLVNDRQLSREKRSRNKKRGDDSIVSNNSSKATSRSRSRKVDDSSSQISKHSSNTKSSSSTSSKDKKSLSTIENWKVKKIYNSNNHAERGNMALKRKFKKDRQGGLSLPKVINIDDQDDDNDLQSVNSLLSSSSYSPPSHPTETSSNANSNASASTTTSQKIPPKYQRSMRPPLPPSSSSHIDSKGIDNGKKSFPAWLVALREKQKIKKREEKIQKDSYENDDDDKSVNTVDLERAAVDAVGKNSVISLFGKRVTLVTRPKSKLPPTKTDIVSDDGNPSPWGIKLKPVNRQAITETEFTPRKLLPSPEPETKTGNRNDPALNTTTSRSPVKLSQPKEQPKHSPKQNEFNCSIAPGDVIDLTNLPQPEFRPEEKPSIVPITNNNDNRCQVVILGDKVLLIASRINHDDVNSQDSEEANVLWYTTRNQIVSLALNNRADGVLISIEDGTSFPLNFENCNQCFSFVQTYYNVKQSLTAGAVSIDPFATPSTNGSSRDEQHRVESTTTTVSRNVFLGTPMTPAIHTEGSFLTPIACRGDETNSEVARALTTADLVKISMPSNVQNTEDELSQDDNATVIKFKKMLKCGVPADAIRHKMTCDGVSTNVQSIVFQESSPTDEINKVEKVQNEPSKSSIANMLEGHFQKRLSQDTGPDTRQTQELTLTEEEEVIASKYRKMLKVGMPMDAVTHAMNRDQVDRKIITVLTDGSSGSKPAEAAKLWTDEEERILDRFKKMVKLKIPQSAIRNKMTVENVDTKIIEAVLGKTEPTPKKEKREVKSESLSSEDENVLAKYKKMMKMGIPPGAVRHSMVKDDVSSSLIDALFGSSSSEPAKTKKAIELNDDEKKKAELYKKMLKMGLPEDAVRHKMTMDNASKDLINVIFNNGTSNSPGNGATLKRKKSGLMPIHWEKLSKEKVGQQSIWMSAKKPRIDAKNIELELQQLFLKKPAGKIQRPSSKDNKTENKMAQILDINRAQMVSISLQSFKQFSLDELVAMINDLDPNNQIKGDRVLFLSGLLPKKEESDSIRKYNGGDDRLIPAEIFFRKLDSVPRVPSKIKVMETMEMFNQNTEEIITQFDILMKTCNDVIKSEKLQSVLESVLTIGNIMNEGTRSGDAIGIKFESLLKLTQTKSKDGKMSVLDYIVGMFIARSNREALKLSSDFPQCSTASRILITDIVSNFTSLESSLKVCKTEQKKMQAEQISHKNSSPGLLRLDAFMMDSDEVLSKLQQKRAQASKACKVRYLRDS